MLPVMPLILSTCFSVAGADLIAALDKARPPFADVTFICEGTFEELQAPSKMTHQATFRWHASGAFSTHTYLVTKREEFKASYLPGGNYSLWWNGRDWGGRVDQRRYPTTHQQLFTGQPVNFALSWPTTWLGLLSATVVDTVQGPTREVLQGVEYEVLEFATPNRCRVWLDPAGGGATRGEVTAASYRIVSEVTETFVPVGAPRNYRLPRSTRIMFERRLGGKGDLTWVGTVSFKVLANSVKFDTGLTPAALEVGLDRSHPISEPPPPGTGDYDPPKLSDEAVMRAAAAALEQRTLDPIPPPTAGLTTATLIQWGLIGLGLATAVSALWLKWRERS